VTTECGTSLGVPILDSCRLTGAPVTTVPGFPTDVVAVPLDPSDSVFGRSFDTATYFVSVNLTRRMRRGSVYLSFVRNEDARGGIGVSTIINDARVGFTYRPSDYWTLRAFGSYITRESVAQFPLTQVSARASAERASPGGPFLAEADAVVASFARQGFQQEIGIVDVTLLRQLTERSRLRFRFRYYNQSRDVASGAERAFQKFLGGVFYDFQFDAFKL
jgi:hypothetical protein